MLLDWLVGLAFPPCQRPFAHRYGVIEPPKWRILPDRFGAEANSPVMDNIGGGPLGISELLYRAVTVPSYLRDDWFRDWGGACSGSTCSIPTPSRRASISAPPPAAGCGARLRCDLPNIRLSIRRGARRPSEPTHLRRLPSSLVPSEEADSTRIARLVAS